MDLNNLDFKATAQDGATVDITHPTTGEDTGIKIFVKGKDSADYRKKSLEIQNRRIAKLSKGKSFSAEMSETEGLELLAAVTTGWDGIKRGGVVVSFSEAEARDLYAGFPFIREQVDAAVADRANFLPKAGMISLNGSGSK